MTVRPMDSPSSAPNQTPEEPSSDHYTHYLYLFKFEGLEPLFLESRFRIDRPRLDLGPDTPPLLEIAAYTRDWGQWVFTHRCPIVQPEPPAAQ